MRCAVRACLVLLVSMLSVVLTIPATPGGPGRAAVEGDSAVCPPLTLAASVASADQSGCCHFGGGICGCKGGRAQCCKGNLMSSCPCGAGATPSDPVLRGGGRDGPPLRIRRAVFTNKTGGPPLSRITSARMGEPVWLWLELDCPDSCVTQLVTGGERDLKVALHWYFDPGSGPIYHDELKVDRAVSPAPQPPQVSIEIKPLAVGNWLAEVGYGADRVCMSDDTTCAFRIRVTR